jgi:hypothetical protein
MKQKNSTLNNKICGFLLIAIGALSTRIDGDSTAFILLTMLSIPVLLAKENAVL